MANLRSFRGVVGGYKGEVKPQEDAKAHQRKLRVAELQLQSLLPKCGKFLTQPVKHHVLR